jgi:hypothetical protein
MAVNRLSPIHLPGNAGKVLRADGDWAIYYQGTRIDEDGDVSFNDTFQGDASYNQDPQEAGRLVRLPKVIRIGVTGLDNTTPGNIVIQDHFQGLGPYLSANLDVPGLSVQTGSVSGAGSPTLGSRYIGWATPGAALYAVGPIQSRAAIAASDLVGGEVLFFLFNYRNLTYGAAFPSPSVGSVFAADHADWLAKRDRFVRLQVAMYQQYPIDFTNVFADLTDEQVHSQGVYGALDPLTDNGWTYTQMDLDSLPAYATFLPVAQAFFA